MHRAIGFAFICCAIGLMLSAPAHALIQVLLPLEQVIKQADYILVAEVAEVDAARPSAVFLSRQTIKGKPPYERIPINLSGDPKLGHTPQFIKRLAPKRPLVLFVQRQDSGKHMMLGFTEGTWFQVIGQPDGDRLRWGFTHCEIYLRRTFKGTTEEMKEVVSDALAGKKRPPRPDPRVAPGFGPEVVASP